MSKTKFSIAGSLMNSKILQNESEPEFTSEDINFYRKFISKKSLRKVEIVSNENIEETFQMTYTVYNIKVVTDSLEYVIPKRYSEFRLLSQKIEKNHKDLLPYMLNFPAKKFWGKTDKEVIDKRALQLNECLKALNTRYHEFDCIEYLGFLQIKDHYEKAGINVQECLIDENMGNKAVSSEEKHLIKILEKINLDPQNLVALFGEIETLFIKSSPILSIDFIKLFLFGENKIKGLIYFCGKRFPNDESHIICSAGLRCLFKLLDIEFNKDAEAFLKIFCNGSTSVISSLQFGVHIHEKSQKPCTLHALRIFDFYLERNPSLKKNLILSILGDSSEGEIYEEYIKWKQQKKFNSSRAENYSYCNSGIISDQDEEEKMDSEETRMHQSKSAEDRRITLDNSSDEFTLKEFLNNKQRQWEKVKQNLENDVKIKHFKGIYIKMVLYSKNDSKQVFNCLKEKTSLFSSILEDYKVLEEKDENNAYIYEKVRWNTSKMLKHLIFISHRKIEKFNENEFYIYKRSINNHNFLIEIKKDDYLADCIFCIRIKTYDKQNERKNKGISSKITIICKNFNQNSVLFLSTDLLGETKILAQNLHDLKLICEKKENI